jgi:hypothetical protein
LDEKLKFYTTFKYTKFWNVGPFRPLSAINSKKEAYQNWMKNKNSFYIFKYAKFGPLLGNKRANF